MRKSKLKRIAENAISENLKLKEQIVQLNNAFIRLWHDTYKSYDEIIQEKKSKEN